MMLGMETEQQSMPDIGEINRRHPSVNHHQSILSYYRGLKVSFILSGVGHMQTCKPADLVNTLAFPNSLGR